MSDLQLAAVLLVALWIYQDQKATKVQATADAAKQIGEGVIDGVGHVLQQLGTPALGPGPSPGYAGAHPPGWTLQDEVV